MFEFVAIALLGLALFSYIHAVSSSSVYWRNYYAIDTSTYLDLIAGAPGSLVVNYRINENTPFSLILKFEKQKVEVYESPEDKNPTPARYYYASDSKTTFENTNIYDTFFSVVKKPGVMSISNTLLYMEKRTCSDILTKDDIKKIKFSVFTDDAQFSKDVKTVLKSFIETNTNKLEEDETKADMIIIITSKNTDEINITSSDKLSFAKSEKLGCIILNKIMANYPKDKSSQSKYSEKDYDVEILKKVSSDKVAIGIVVGNKNQKNPSEFARLIFEAINEYYG
jgi:hypothetical protein